MPDDALSIIERELAGHAAPDGTRAIGRRRNPGGPEQAAQRARPPASAGDAAQALLAGFDEQSYLIAFPDIAAAIAAGDWESGLDHFVNYGIHENRLEDRRYRDAVQAPDSAGFPASGIDAVFVSHTGWRLVIGWVNDETAPLREVACHAGERFAGSAPYAARCRREDAEAAVPARHGKLLGFWTVFRCADRLNPSAEVRASLATGHERKSWAMQASFVQDERLREIAFEYLASARYFANPQAEAALQLESGLGQALIDCSIELSGRVTAGAYVARFGPQPGRLDGSIVVCLFGRAEFLFLQAAAFSGCAGAERYEFVYVSNSPELAETLIKEATIASRIYGIAITLVILPDNAGFGAANNAAVAHARSRRILITNPDVFPRDRDWATRHSAIVAGLPAEQTALFGAPLYYDDGSLMHGGMFFDIDTGLSIREGRIERHEGVRVEHYAKGAPPGTQAFLNSRRVPAVTGAFISADRAWFERLGGFSPEYVFGHYEDADLCLRSLAAGRPVWVHNLPLWHLEGKGSTRRLVHEGGSLVNRWHFTRLWKDFIVSELIGRAPARLRAA